MFGIGLPEMIVILAVALIVVGPDKLPDLARSLAKGMFELKKTVNQVKASLDDEDNLIGSVHSDLKKTADDLKGDLLESDHFTWKEPEGGEPRLSAYENDSQDGEVIDADEVQPLKSESEKDTDRPDKNTDSAEKDTDRPEDKDLPADGKSSEDDSQPAT